MNALTPAISNDLTNDVRNAVNEDYKRKEFPYNDSGYVELETSTTFSAIVSALHTLNYDNRFRFTLGYDRSMHAITWQRYEDKAKDRISAQQVINELESVIDAIKQAQDNRLIEFISHDYEGYLVETIDDSTEFRIALTDMSRTQ